MCVCLCHCVSLPEPTMSLFPSKLQLSPLVCLYLLCLLLLLTDSISTVAEVKPLAADSLTQLNTTQANCSSACNNGVIENTTVKDSSETSSTTVAALPPQKNMSSISVSHKLNDTVAPLIPPNQSALENHSSTASPSNRQPVSPDHQLLSPESETQPATLHSSTTAALPTEAAHTGSITSTGTIPSTTADPVRNVYITPVLVTLPTKRSPISTTKATSTITAKTPIKTIPTSPTTAVAPHPATTVKPTITLTKANTTVTITTTTGIRKSSPPSSAAMPQTNASSAGKTPVQTTFLSMGPATLTVTSTITPTNHNEPVALGTRVAVVEVAGAAMTGQLVDTASLLAILLFGLLFFLVTVAVFVTQAYESYRRRDYTQVDYLINGMYTDSGV